MLAAEVTRFIDAAPYPCEVVLVNDGSTDRTIEFLVDWSARDRRIKVLSFSRNFGHQLAATAGVDYAAGDAVVLIDADLQDPLDVIHQMVARVSQWLRRGLRAAIRSHGREPLQARHRMVLLPPDAYLFSPVAAAPMSATFALCLAAALQASAPCASCIAFCAAWWPGSAIRKSACATSGRPRVAGTTKYPLSRMIRLAWNAAVSFSPLPLRMSFFAGGIMALLAIEEAVRAFVAYLHGRTVPGWTSLMIVLCMSNAALADHCRHSGRVRRQDLRGEQRTPALHRRRRVERCAHI